MSTHNRDQMPKPDFLTDAEWELLLKQTATLDQIRGDAKADVESYLANPDGRSKGIPPWHVPTLLLTHFGRKSGKPHITPLVFLSHEGELFIVGSLAGYDEDPAWVKNLRARPECEVQLDRERSTARAREVTDATEREKLWPLLRPVFPSWYYFQQTTTRPFGIFGLTLTGRID